MKRIPLTIALAAGLSGSVATAATAAPSFCTGTTVTAASGDFVAGSFLVNVGPGTSTGNCVEAADKFFGAFSVSGAITGGGSAGWTFTMASGPTDVTLSFAGAINQSQTGAVNYTVETDPLKSNGALISALEKDFTFNQVAAGGSATLTGVTTPNSAANVFGGNSPQTSFSCTRNGGPSDTCPQERSFSPLISDLTVNETVVTNANARVTGLTDTVFQAIPGIPEPTSLALLGTALAMLGLVGSASRRQH